MVKTTKKSTDPLVKNEIYVYRTSLVSLIHSFREPDISEKLLHETLSMLNIIMDWAEHFPTDSTYQNLASLFGEITPETHSASAIVLLMLLECSNAYDECGYGNTYSSNYRNYSNGLFERKRNIKNSHELITKLQKLVYALEHLEKIIN